MDPFPFYLPTPPDTSKVDGYIETLRSRIDAMSAFEAKYSCELSAKEIEKAKLSLAETHREKIADDFKIQLPGNAEELKALSAKMENEINAIEGHIRSEEERYMPVPLDDPAYRTAVNVGSILFDTSIIADMRECLERINQCLAFIEG